VADSAVGSPVTLPGFHSYDLTIAGIPTTLWDSAGLEVGDPKAWSRNLKDELEFRGPTQPIQRWFHTILYCIQAPGSRVERYEVDIIKQFLIQKYRVIVVFTKCYIGPGAIEKLERSVKKAITDAIPVVKINSRHEEMHDGVVVRRFGRNELIKEINIALIESLIERIPARCIGFMAKYVDKKCDELIAYIETHTGIDGRDAVARTIERGMTRIVTDVRSPGGHFQRIIIRETKHAVATYREIAGLLETVLVYDEELPGASSELSSDTAVPRVQKYWDHVQEVWDEIFDESSVDFSDYVGEIGDSILKGLATILSLPLALIGGGVEYIDERLSYTKMLVGKVSALRDTVKKELLESDERIRQLFADKMRRM
jgi:hypothetical protein